MSYTIFYTESYNKHARKFLKKHPVLIHQYQKTLELLELNPFHPSLRLHPLKGIYSVSINLSYRITLELIIEEEKIILIKVGDHGKVY